MLHVVALLYNILDYAELGKVEGGPPSYETME